MSWSDILVGFPQASILGSRFLFIYLFDGLQCYPKQFADDTSLFATEHNMNKATNDLNNSSTKMIKWALHWKISFNPGTSKQAHEIIFSCKRSIVFHPPLTFNNIPVVQTNSEKHLGLQLDKKLNFEECLSKVVSKVNKTIGVIRKL